MVRPFLAVMAVSLLATAGAQVAAPEWVPGLVSAEEAAEGFYPLFNGTDLGGWTVVGPDKLAFEVQDGVLATGGTGELVHDQVYERFVLRYEYRALAPGATPSIWAEVADGAAASSGRAMQVQLPASAGEWKKVECVRGGADVRPGRIVICGGNLVELRNMRLKPLPGGNDWRGLREGEVFKDFQLRLSFMPKPGARGAVLLRQNERGRCFDVTIDNAGEQYITGSIRGKAPAIELRALDNCWNAMDIVARGRNVQIVVNGKRVLDFIDTSRRGIRAGRIELADGDGGVQFKDIEIKPISQE